MSFSLPKNVPRFDDVQRNYENTYWAQARNASGVSNAISGLLEGKELPMYKDKPYNYPRSTRRPLWRRKRSLAGALLVFIILYWTYFGNGETKTRAASDIWNRLRWRPSSRSIWERRMQEVRVAYEASWDGYERYALGEDEFHPITRTGGRTAQGGLGNIWADSLDGLMIMNSTSRLSRARQWAVQFLKFSKNQEVSTFDTSSRLLGGLLSAHFLSTEVLELENVDGNDGEEIDEDMYIEKATDLVDRLFGAFDSPSNIPYPLIHLETRKGTTSKDNGHRTTTAHAIGMQLEFRYLSKLLGEKLFWDAAEKTSQTLDAGADSDNLIRGLIVHKTGAFVSSSDQLSSLTVPYFEYLVKEYLQTSQQEPIYHEIWTEALASIRKKFTAYSEISHFTVLGEAKPGTNILAMEETACKLPGLIVLAATGGRSLTQARKNKSWNRERENEVAFSKELMNSCWALYKASPSGLAAAKSFFKITLDAAPEAPGVYPSAKIDWGANRGSSAKWKDDISLDPDWAQNNQDASFVESLLYLYRVTEEETYRQWGWELFTSYINYTSTPAGDGFVALSSVLEPPQQVDVMNGLWLSRTLKFFYLLFAPLDLLPLDKVIFTTSGHVLPRFKLNRGLNTGWKRKARSGKSKVTGASQQGEETTGSRPD